MMYSGSKGSAEASSAIEGPAGKSHPHLFDRYRVEKIFGYESASTHVGQKSRKALYAEYLEAFESGFGAAY